MKIKPMMERLMHLFAERDEILPPANACAEVRILGIDFQSYLMGQAIEHAIDEIVQLNE